MAPLPWPRSTNDNQPGLTKVSKQLLVLIFAAAIAGCVASSTRPGVAALRTEVMATERAFAKTMAARDLEAFATYISGEAIFFSGNNTLKGRAGIRAAWAKYFTDAQAPFSWEPDTAEVLSSGTLALTSGPVRDPDGKVIARFNSIWRLEAPGKWRIIFDKGSPIAKEDGS